MNILFIAHEQMINGASHSMIDIIDKLSDRYNFIIVTPFNNGPFVDEMKKRNVEIYYAPFYRWVDFKNDEYKKKRKHFKKSYDKINQILAEKLYNLIKDKNIDIIHTNTSVVDFGYRLSKIMNIPHIWHIREFGEKDFNMYPLCSYREYYKKIADNNNLICISKEVMKKFIDKVPSASLNLIYNGVSKKNLNSNKEYNLDKNQKIICLQSGMISKTKGQDITIKAIEKLVNEGYDIELLIAGNGNVKNLGINIENKKWLKILGQVDNLPEIRKNVDIEIVSSKSEAFGRVTVEAMMGGIAVVGSNSGGTKELIKNKETGLLFECGNYIDLSEKVKYLCNNRDELKRIGSNAFLYSKDYFLIDRCANEIYDLYKKIGGK